MPGGMGLRQCLTYMLEHKPVPVIPSGPESLETRKVVALENIDTSLQELAGCVRAGAFCVDN